MNTQLNKQLHGLWKSTGLQANKVNLILGFSHGRGESSTCLTDQEAQELINYLKTQRTYLDQKQDEAANKMRRKMISLAHSMHWHLSGTQKVDVPRLNRWCKTFGRYHKALNDHTHYELTELVTQFEIVYKSYLHNI